MTTIYKTVAAVCTKSHWLSFGNAQSVLVYHTSGSSNSKGVLNFQTWQHGFEFELYTYELYVVDLLSGKMTTIILPPCVHPLSSPIP